MGTSWGGERLLSELLPEAPSPPAPISAAHLSLQPVGKPFPFCGERERFHGEAAWVLGGGILSMLPSSPLLSRAPRVRGPFLLYLEPELPPSPRPGLSSFICAHSMPCPVPTERNQNQSLNSSRSYSARGVGKVTDADIGDISSLK